MIKLEEKKIQSKVFFFLDGKVVARFNFHDLSFYDDKCQPTLIIPTYFNDRNVGGDIWFYAVKYWCKAHLSTPLPRLTLEMTMIERAAALGVVLLPQNFTDKELESLRFDKGFLALIEECGAKNNQGHWLLSSTIYHAIQEEKGKRLFEKRGYSKSFISYFFAHEDYYEGITDEEVQELWHLYSYHCLYLMGEANYPADFLLNWWVLAHELNEPIFIHSSPIVELQTRKMRSILKKNDSLTTAIKKNNDLDWLYYEDSEYLVRPLISAQDFHDEATQQNNCVERMYLEDVANGKTHIAVLRRKADPAKSFITIEINNNRCINQYLAKNNANSPAEIHAVMRAYQKHLNGTSREPVYQAAAEFEMPF